MKLIDLLKVLYGYNEIELYDNNRQYLGFYYNVTEIKEEYQNQKILSVWVNDHGQLEIVIEKK
jgi:hypothetical protein